MIFISFATIKGADYQDARDGIIMRSMKHIPSIVISWNGTALQKVSEDALKNWIITPRIQE